MIWFMMLQVVATLVELVRLGRDVGIPAQAEIEAFTRFWDHAR